MTLSVGGYALLYLASVAAYLGSGQVTYCCGDKVCPNCVPWWMPRWKSTHMYVLTRMQDFWSACADQIGSNVCPVATYIRSCFAGAMM